MPKRMFKEMLMDFSVSVSLICFISLNFAGYSMYNKRQNF